MKKLLLLLALLAPPAFSQPSRLHDLKAELVRVHSLPAGYSRDTVQFRILKDMMRFYADTNVDSAFYYRDLVIKHCDERGLEKEMIYAHQYTGVLYQIKSEFYQSIRFYYKALSLAEKLKEYKSVAAAYGGLAHAYSRLNQNSRALSSCELGLRVLNTLPDSMSYWERLSLLNVQGVVYRKMRRLDDALKVNTAMYHLARVKPYDRWYESHGLHAIGLVYKELGDIPMAIQYHKNALGIAQKTGSVELEGNILINIGDIYMRQGKWKQASFYIDKARRMAISVKNTGIETESYEKLYAIYSKLKMPAQSLLAFERYVSLKDSLLREKNEQRIEAMQEQYENARKTNLLAQQVQLMAKTNENQRLAQSRNLLFYGLSVIVLIACLLVWHNRRLQGKNRELERKNAEIKAALFKGQTIERKRVALELHDNLSGLLSAVNMSVQSLNPQSLTAPEQSVYQNVKHLIQNAYAEVRNISHNILPAELEKEGLPVALKKLIDRLNQNLPLEFSLNIAGLNERLPPEIEYNLYSIAFELVNNVVKHAEADFVAIQLTRTDAGVDLSVTDNGIGLGQHEQKQGVGLQNIYTRLESLGGYLDAGPGDNGGTRMDIKIPIEAVHVNGNKVGLKNG
ncbi:Histidine kinase-, DNA gyrase B-, and HSP90-like ATPase [Dyadobacter soli]|uniref:Histidine kinase-, DNA gyrase B-, and HSP90-like ATPase n=1 Tax=Dyadobacter soli TaxID=659014 RepID=A0A1G7WT96_9BACT|nr:sensor histidine kinase [Dyadobacter soli]SDG75142.1 Histidine kinase-, DNA gyrase B-, and HSP90-like ATPase [Dyadobacter soli]